MDYASPASSSFQEPGLPEGQVPSANLNLNPSPTVTVKKGCGGGGKPRGQIWSLFTMSEDVVGLQKAKCNYCLKYISPQAQRLQKHIDGCREFALSLAAAADQDHGGVHGAAIQRTPSISSLLTPVSVMVVPEEVSGNAFMPTGEILGRSYSEPRPHIIGFNADKSSKLHHLQKMKRRLETVPTRPNPPIGNTTVAAAAEKVELLEKTLNAFRIEVDMKLKIIQQILTTRNEQVKVQKKLLDREETLYTVLISHWLNTSTLAASGVSMNFSTDIKENLENELNLDSDFPQEDFQPVSMSPTASSNARPPKKSRRKRRKVAKFNSPGPFQEPGTQRLNDFAEADTFDVDESDSSDDGGGCDRQEEWNPSGVGNITDIKHEPGDGGYEVEHGNCGDDDYGELHFLPKEISVDAKKRITNLVDQGITKPEIILSQLIEYGYHAPTMTQIITFLQNLRRDRDRGEPSSTVYPGQEYRPRNS